jgi:enoyl-CoA hydratase
MDTIEIETPTEGVRLVRLNRPERLNALDFTMTGELHDALDDIAGDDSAKVIVLTGAGRGFCAGLDLRDTGVPPEPGTHRRRHAGTSGQAFIADLTLHLRETPQVVIAAVNGPAYGGGLAIAAACDLRIAAESASFCSAFIRTGLTGTDIGITYFLPRLVGAAHAFDLILTGRTIGAGDAERMGLVSRVTEDADLLDTAVGMAEGMAAYTTYGLQRTKEVLWHNLDATSAAAAIALENRNQELGILTPEVREYMADYARRLQR